MFYIFSNFAWARLFLMFSLEDDKTTLDRCVLAIENFPEILSRALDPIQSFSYRVTETTQMTATKGRS